MKESLKAAAQRLAEEAWKKFTSAPTFNTQDFTCNVQSAILKGMKLALEEAGEDAGRYRWLRNRSGASNRLPHVTQYPDDPADYIQVWDKNGYHPERLDAAIDAARKGETHD